MAVVELAEVIAAPYTCWVATPGTVFPKITEEEGSFPTGWTKVGTSGTFNYSEAGVTVTHTQTQGQFISAGGVIARKVWRQDEGMKVAFDLVDLSPKQYGMIMDNAAVTEVTGAEARAEIPLKRGISVKAWAMVLRGKSTLNEAHNGQYNINCAVQAGNPAPKFALKGGPAMLALDFDVLELEPGQLATFIAAK